MEKSASSDNNSRKVGGIILAAGASRRMGQNKLLLPLPDGRTVIETVLDNALSAGLDDLVLISGAERAAIEAAAAGRGVRTVHNPGYEQGQSTSMRQGLLALPTGHAALFILGDQPLIKGDIHARIVSLYRESGARIIAPRGREGRRGNPCLFAPELFGELLAVAGDQGGRPVLSAHAAEISFVDMDDDAVLLDIDTPEQYQNILRRRS